MTNRGTVTRPGPPRRPTDGAMRNMLRCSTYTSAHAERQVSCIREQYGEQTTYTGCGTDVVKLVSVIPHAEMRVRRPLAARCTTRPA